MKNGQESVRQREQKEQVFEESLFSFLFLTESWSFLSVLRYEKRLASDIKWEEEIRGKREREKSHDDHDNIGFLVCCPTGGQSRHRCLSWPCRMQLPSWSNTLVSEKRGTR